MQLLKWVSSRRLAPASRARVAASAKSIWRFFFCLGPLCLVPVHAFQDHQIRPAPIYTYIYSRVRGIEQADSLPGRAHDLFRGYAVHRFPGLQALPIPYGHPQGLRPLGLEGSLPGQFQPPAVAGHPMVQPEAGNLQGRSWTTPPAPRKTVEHHGKGQHRRHHAQALHNGFQPRIAPI